MWSNANIAFVSVHSAEWSFLHDAYSPSVEEYTGAMLRDDRLHNYHDNLDFGSDYNMNLISRVNSA